MKLTITHHPAPEQQGIPASEAPEGVPLLVVALRNFGNPSLCGQWCVRAGPYIAVISTDSNHSGMLTAEHYRVIPLAPGESITIARDAERSE